MHITTRPAFVLVLAFLVLMLIPFWAAVGVFATEAEDGAGEQEGGHGEMMMMMENRSVREAFAQATRAFMATSTRPDGCVVPAVMQGEARPMKAMDMAASSMPGGEEGDAAGGAPGDSARDPEGGRHGAAEPAVPVAYIQAIRFGYLPPRLCFEVGKTYELRMMATDVIHGASMQFGLGSRIVRLPPGMPVTERVRFTKPGEYLLYCTFYCGLGHQYMQARIVVEPAVGAAS